MPKPGEMETLHQVLTEAVPSGWWRQRRAAQRLTRIAIRTNGQHISLSQAEARAIAEGLVAGLESIHWSVHVRCQQALINLQHPQVIEAVCAMLLERDIPRLRVLATHAHYTPQAPAHQAAYRFVTNQTNPSVSTEEDTSLLEDYYIHASHEARAHLLHLARARGEPRWSQLITTFLQTQGAAALGPGEIEATIEALYSEQHMLWTLALYGSLPCSWRAVQALHGQGWQPAGALACWTTLVNAVNAVREPAKIAACAGVQRALLEEHQAAVSALAMHPDGTLLATGDRNGTILLWDLPGGTRRGMLTGHQEAIRSLVFSPCTPLLVSGGFDHIVLWDLASGRRVATLPSPAWSLAISTDGATLASGRWDQTITLWHLPSGRLQSTLRGPHNMGKSWVHALVMSPDGSLLAHTNRRSIILWDLQKQQRRAVLRGHTARVNALAMSPDGTTLISSQRPRSFPEQTSIILWDLASAQKRAVLPGEGFHWSLAIGADGMTLASDGLPIALRDLSHPQHSHVLPEAGRIFTLSSRGGLLASGGLGTAVTLWEVENIRHFATVPLGSLGQDDLQRVHSWLARGCLTPERNTVAQYIAAVLEYRLATGTSGR
jgi:WD40 repeat protein